MGMVSFVEDIQKVRDDAIHFRGLLADNAFLDGPAQQLADQARKQVPGYLRVLDGVIAHFDAILEIATDPSMNLAEEILRLKGEMEGLGRRFDARVQTFQKEIEKQKAAAASSARNFREELRKRDEDYKKRTAAVTKEHVRTLENQNRAHLIEKNEWLKKMEEYEFQARAGSNSSPSVRLDVADLEFASAFESFGLKDDDVR